MKALARAVAVTAVALLALQARPAGAAVYNWQISSGAALEGMTTNWAEACGTNPTAVRITTMTTAGFGCTGSRIGDSVATANHVFLTMISSSAYASATNVSAGSLIASLRNGTGTNSLSVDFQIGYVTSGAFTGFGSPVAQAMTATQSTYTINLSAQSGTVPAGAFLAVRVRKVQAVSDQARLYLGTNNANSGRLTITESAAGTTTIGNGTAPTSLTLAPGAAITDLDAFTLVGTAADTVTAATVTLTPAGAFNNIGQVTLTNSAGTTTYGTVNSPASNTVSFTGMTLPVTTTSTTFKVRITPKTHAAMPAVPGAQYAIQGVVSAFTCGNTQAGSNTTAGSATLTIDNLSPADVTGLSATAGNGQLVVNWTNPATDYARTLVIYRATTAISDVPVEGTTSYAAPGTLGASTIAYVGGTAGAAGTTTITGLANDTLHNVKVFVQDGAGNWSTPGAATSGTPTAPAVPPGAPGAPTYSGASTSSVTVNWAAATGAATYTVDVSTDGTNFSLAQAGVAGTSFIHGTRAANTRYWYRVTAVNVAGSTEGLGSSTWTLTNPVAAAPAAGTISPLSIAVSWTAPTPAATSYLVEWSLTSFGAVAGSTTVTGTTATASGLTQATAYYFRVTALNGAGVPATSASPVGGPFTTTSGPTLVVGDGTNPGNSSICPSPTAPSGATLLDAFTLQATSTDDVVSRITVQLAPAGAWVNVATVEITNAGGTTSYGSAIPGGDLVNVYVTGVSQAVGVTTPYAVRITPKAHAAMPAPNVGQQYAMTGTVVAIASNNPRAYGDTASATVTVDNLAPAEITWTGVTTGASNIQLDWTAATSVVVLRKQGGPVTDSPVDGSTYTAGSALGGSTVACAGSVALCNSPGLAAGTAYSFKVFTRDACGNYSRGAAVGPLFPGGLNEGDALAGTLAPVVAILNPMNPATVTNLGTTGFRVQVRAFSRMNAGVAQPFAVGAVRLKAATPTQTFTATCNAANFPIELVLNARYPSSTAAGTDNHGVYEATVKTVDLGNATRGAFTLRACASNASGTVLSGPVGITVNDGSAGSPRGDGNLLVRDNGAQLCGDCHAIATHASESVGSDHGSWYAACRDCHTPHNTTNVELIRTQITPPGYRGPQAPRVVVFSDRSTGYSATGGASKPSAAAFANADGTGICQVCHTQTTYYLSSGGGTGHNPGQRCTDCHSHVKGLKASCTECHGDKTGAYPAIAGADGSVAAAPPTAADKVTTTGVKVGAHQAHVNGKGGAATYRSNPLACASCHTIPNSHNGTIDAAWSVLATNTIIDGNAISTTPLPAAGLGGYDATWEGTPNCTNACHGANLPSNAVKPIPSWTATGGLTCASCHGAPPPLSATPDQHHPQSTACDRCHGAGYGAAAVNKPTHIDGTLDRTTSGCTACHGEVGAPGVTLTASLIKAAPGGSGSGTNSYDTAGLASGNAVGAHEAHLVGNGTGNTPRWRSSPIACTECHALPPLDTDTSHATGVSSGGARAFMTWTGGIAQSAAFETKAASYTQPTCSSVYCHNPLSTDTGATNKTPAWNGASTVAQCGTCHGLPPATAAHPADPLCSTCHEGYADSPGSASTVAQVNAIAHLNGQLDGGGDCVGCHEGAKGTRRAIVPEFRNAWSHKRSTSGGVPANTVVTKFDCAVCHMEGDTTTGATTTAHKNGVLDLRDPDTGTTIEGVTFGGTGAGAYTSTGTPLTFTQFSRDLGSATLEPAVQAIMINQCLKCHDGDGAASPLARVPTSEMPGSSNAKPFGTTIAGTAYTGIGVTANGILGAVVDVNESFKVTNSSYHPVTGKQNNWYSKLTRMAAPWNGATRGATVDVTSWGPLISCWDCHAPDGTGSTATLTATVTAHGGATTLRGTATYSGPLSSLPAKVGTYPVTPPATAVTLCTTCHALYDTCGGSGVNNCTTTPAHGAGSALRDKTNGNMQGALQFACNWCHSSGSLTAVTRPVRAQDAHGVNDVAAGGAAKSGRWATANPKPYAFIRNTSLLGDHSPAQISTTTYLPVCDMVASPCNQGSKEYLVGGTY